MSSPAFTERHRTDRRHFTRERCLTLPNLVLFLLNLVKGSLQDELDHFFSFGASLIGRVATKSAFSQARKKFTASAFVELLEHVVGAFYALGQARLWHGHRLLAVDGSTLSLPDTLELEVHFGAVARERGNRHPLARVALLYDVLNRVPISSRIAPIAEGEKTAATHLLDSLRPNDILLGDRLYPGFVFCRQILAQQAHFCFRVRTRFNAVVSRFYLSDADEQIVTWTPTADNHRELRSLELPTESIRVRLLRFRLPNGRTELLMTSLLDTNRYPHSIFYELYGLRWRIEEGFKLLKLRALLESFSGRSVLAISQDFHAKVLAVAISAMLALPADRHWEEHATANPNQKSRQVNFTQALSRLKDRLVAGLRGLLPLVDLAHFFLEAALCTTEQLRPGRNFLRDYPKHRPPSQVYKPLR